MHTFSCSTLHLEADHHYKLVRSFIAHQKMNYRDNYLKYHLPYMVHEKFVKKWSTRSLNTLLLYCQHRQLPSLEKMGCQVLDSEQERSSMREQLLEWAWNLPWKDLDASFQVSDLSEFVIGILQQSFRERSEPLQERVAFDFEDASQPIQYVCYFLPFFSFRSCNIKL